MSDRKLKFNIENIGPIKEINTEFCSDSLKVALFATNGSGKTFIGRCFDLLSNAQQNINIEKFDNLINFNNSEAKFLFDYSDNNNLNKFYFRINKNGFIEKEFNSNFIIHVFNKEFVDKNVAKNNYAIDSNSITGEILIGDETIDVAKDENDLKELKENHLRLSEIINKNLKICWKNVADLGIRTNLAEFAQINYKNLLSQTHYSGVSFDEAKNNYSIIKNIPENLEEIPYLKYTLDIDLFNEIESSIKKVVNISTVSDEFKTKILNKTTFIKNGLQLFDRKKEKYTICKN